MKNFYFLKNNLFTNYTLEVSFKKNYPFEENLSETFEKICSLYDKEKFQNQNEPQIEDEFISKTLKILGWHSIYQESKIIQGKIEKPDFLLFTDEKSKAAYQNIPSQNRYSSNDKISVILESKAYNIAVDNKKVKDNPHFQILRYLNSLRIHFGFLTNGRLWRFYDNSKLSSEKIFYEIDLEAIIENNDCEAFKYFYFVFRAENFMPVLNQQEIPIAEVLFKNTQSKKKIEDDLKALIYGIDNQDSIFEKIGSCIYAKNEGISLEDVYKNALYFTFRLLFIAYFEDKFDETLQAHKYFKDEISLQNLLEQLDDKEDSFSGFVQLQKIFNIYDKGEPNYDMPIFNGGLFDATKTKPLYAPKLFSNKDLKEILEKFFYFKESDKHFKRDYRTLSISHLGTIYEGLLTYFFQIAQEDIFYIAYSSKKSKSKQSEIEGYFDSYDYEKIKKTHTIQKAKHYTKGQIYLKNTSNSRKTTASYYTPESVVSYLVKECLQNKITPENILQFKILDNACGSGHFLVEALNQITLEILHNFDAYEALKAIYEKEKQTIIDNTAQYIANYQIDESDILKRLLLKRTIFGVDLNPFSIELTKLSLWIDSFIFGTPLSFIEHHIKCGNALIGSSIEEFKKFYSDYNKNARNLFIQNFLKEFDALSDVFKQLDSLKDTTEEEILESKRIYKEQITPILENLNLLLDCFSALQFFTPEEKRLFDSLIKTGLQDLFDNKEIKALIQTYAKTYKFFNYETEFPEIVEEGKFKGFQAIIGNPPWDKTKFSDSDFFPQYKSDYRTLSNTQKSQLQKDLLSKPYIKEAYEAQKFHIAAANNFYKTKYPYSRGSGDGNLFRFFVERNLSLLEEGANLGYILPSALMFEEGSLALRKHILEDKTLHFFYGFENREGIFPDIANHYKFALMQIQNTPAPKNHTIQTMFYQTNTHSLNDASKVILLDYETISSLSPHHLALMELRDKLDLSILQKCYQSFPTLSLQWLDFRNELHMTADKDLFIEISGGGGNYGRFMKARCFINSTPLFIPRNIS
ncbi:N-6 DNA methylase [Helicobacter sp. 12S02634-8]|uniref:Eco57I restriction-modification methylase domain-containing protein n=1 Tax=Helicobacter sp. 12S02634-8 TaxID=1476199 RepID=UPI00209BCDE9|nr:N-6 DNA methylase [Helicobacter sp. 12S02634-8]